MRSGLFEHWQSEYAEHGVATFPVRSDKTPAVRGYLRVGSQASAQLAISFPDALGIGLACKRNGITVLDVDTPDERVLGDWLTRLGRTPFVVRTGSGNFQAWYRHNGEGRRIRPDPKAPVDILGDGFVVAPPSQANTGTYRIIQGSLDDLDRLPKMRDGPAVVTPEPTRGLNVRVGNRNNALWRHAMTAVRQCRTIEQLMEAAFMFNQQEMPELLSDAEVLKVVASAWAYELEGKNWIGRGARVALGFNVVDGLASKDPHAFALFSILQRHHGGTDKPFVIANSMADSLGWTLRAFRAARDDLVARGLLVCVHDGGRGLGDAAKFTFGAMG